MQAQTTLLPPRNLILVNRPGWQALEDFEAIRSCIRQKAPDINVSIASVLETGERLAKSRRHPSLTVSPSDLGNYRPRRGPVFHGRQIGKVKQLERLKRLGILVPHTILLEPGIQLEPSDWGSHVLVKPAHSKSSLGQGFILMPANAIRYVGSDDYPEGHPGRSGPMMVQQFIRTGTHAQHYRVLVFLGQALYCMRHTNKEPLPSLDSVVGDYFSSSLASNTENPGDREIDLIEDRDVIELSLRAFQAFPYIPLKGIDIVRDIESGELYVLELNCKCNSWGISSRHFAPHRRGNIERKAIIAQFGAFEVAANALIRATRQYAA